jgi:hypothetical protein
MIPFPAMDVAVPARLFDYVDRQGRVTVSPLSVTGNTLIHTESSQPRQGQV